MKTRASKANRQIDRSPAWRLGPVTVALTLVLVTSGVYAGGGDGEYRPSDAVSFEEIPGSKVKRVILTEKAAQRLGIEVGPISEQRITRRQLVGGQVVLPVELTYPAMVADATPSSGFGGFSASQSIRVRTVADKDPDKHWIRVTLSQGELDRMNKDEPVRILPLATRGRFDTEITAASAGMPPIPDPKRSMLSLYYVVPHKIDGLSLNDRVRVEMEVTGDGETRLVAPYESVYYDGDGAAWVYANTGPLTYERQRIDIERIEGPYAILRSGPPIDTQVVTVGAALLYGAEVIFKR